MVSDLSHREVSCVLVYIKHTYSSMIKFESKSH